MNNWWEELPRSDWIKFEEVKQSQEWFEVYKPLPGIYAIWEPGHLEKVISYLIIGSKKSLLFDTGLGIGDIKRVVDGLADSEIVVLNSHTHWDHIGGNYQFNNIYGIDTDFTKINSQGKSNDEIKQKVIGDKIWKKTPNSFSVGNYHIKPFRIRHAIKDKEKIDLGDRLLEIIFTPGHSPDSICLLDSDNRYLFTGDTFYLSALYAHLPGSDFEAYFRSASQLASIAESVDKLLPSHKVTSIDSTYLKKMYKAFRAIKEKSASFAISHGNREYLFENFSIIVKGFDE
jgi:glyoxylase-like metal-dependent hydrolase (beta-lactamase superfamily II)